VRVLAWFSCGAPSAVAAKLTVQKYPDAEVLYCDTGGEHPDNLRFLADVERWLDRTVKVLRNPKYVDHFAVFEKERFIVGPFGAKCAGVLKRDLRQAYQRDGDLHVFGFDAEEQDRATSFEEGNPGLKCWWPLIDEGLTVATRDWE
jgi:3'-phosphoadenosine 5'-phosphosulfate sulfotransferase (PAPS reductase)/FAD synthetase